MDAAQAIAEARNILVTKMEQIDDSEARKALSEACDLLRRIQKEIDEARPPDQAPRT